MRLSQDPRCRGTDVASLVRKTSKLCGKAYAYPEGKGGDINAFTTPHKQSLLTHTSSSGREKAFSIQVRSPRPG